MSDIIVEEDPVNIEERAIVEDEVEAGPSVAELQALYEAERKKNEGLAQQADSTQALRSSFDGFRQTLQDVVQRPQYVQQAPQSQEDDMNALMDDFDKNFLDAPSKKIMKLNSKMLQGPLESLVGSQFTMAKRLVQVESNEKELFKQYEKEIEGEFAKIPLAERAQDPVAAYERSFSMVKGRHFDEIFSQRASKMGAEAPKSAPTQQNVAPGTQRVASSPLATPPRDGKPEPIRLKAGQKDRIYDMMRQRGIHESGFATYVEILHESGQLASI